VISGSGERIEGAHLPLRDEVRALACVAMRHFLPNRSIGWDIAIAEDGPVIVEASRIWTPCPRNDLAPVPARIARR
jgi:hypothetical protein